MMCTEAFDKGEDRIRGGETSFSLRRIWSEDQYSNVIPQKFYISFTHAYDLMKFRKPA